MKKLLVVVLMLVLAFFMWALSFNGPAVKAVRSAYAAQGPDWPPTSGPVYVPRPPQRVCTIVNGDNGKRWVVCCSGGMCTSDPY